MIGDKAVDDERKSMNDTINIDRMPNRGDMNNGCGLMIHTRNDATLITLTSKDYT
jgi:hypothetical protein